MKPVMLVFFLLAFVIISCRKNVSAILPPETHIGAYTLGCKVNGEVYRTSGKSSIGLLNFGFVSYYLPGLSTNKVQISAAGSFNVNFRCDLYISSADTGTYLLKSSGNYGIFEEKDQIDSTGLKSIYRTTDNNTGSVTITYSDGTILAGIFEMDAVDGEGNLIHITEGRFDIGR